MVKVLNMRSRTGRCAGETLGRIVTESAKCHPSEAHRYGVSQSLNEVTLAPYDLPSKSSAVRVSEGSPDHDQEQIVANLKMSHVC